MLCVCEYAAQRGFPRGGRYLREGHQESGYAYKITRLGKSSCAPKIGRQETPGTKKGARDKDSQKWSSGSRGKFCRGRYRLWKRSSLCTLKNFISRFRGKRLREGVSRVQATGRIQGRDLRTRGTTTAATWGQAGHKSPSRVQDGWHRNSKYKIRDQDSPLGSSDLASLCPFTIGSRTRRGGCMRKGP